MLIIGLLVGLVVLALILELVLPNSWKVRRPKVKGDRLEQQSKNWRNLS